MNQTLWHDSSSFGQGLRYAGPERVMAAVSLACQGWLVLAACGSIAQGGQKMAVASARHGHATRLRHQGPSSGKEQRGPSSAGKEQRVTGDDVRSCVQEHA